MNLGPFIVVSVQGIYHAGVVKETGSVRKKTLVQAYTDGGVRTMAVADIWMNDPSRSDRQW